MRILLLSAYDAASHRYWREGLVEHLPDHSWTILTLPPRFFSWRIRGNVYSWLSENRDTLNSDYDLIIATSMVDLATLKGVVPKLANIPTILYFHENQFAYPASDHTHASVEAHITSIYSALAATQLVFNSAYNRDSYFAGARALLRKMPDHAPLTLLAELEARSSVLPVPLDDRCFHHQQAGWSTPLTLLWNHRWEYDKGPEQLYLLMQKLQDSGLNFRIHIIGQQFRQTPKIFDRIHHEFRSRIASWGFIENREAYLDILRQSDLVISTALHDFQGIAVMEAIAAGACPVAPSRLAYPEYIPAHCLTASYPTDPEKEAEVMARKVIALSHTGTAAPRIDLTPLSWRSLSSDYRQLIKQALSRHQ